LDPTPTPTPTPTETPMPANSDVVIKYVDEFNTLIKIDIISNLHIGDIYEVYRDLPFYGYGKWWIPQLHLAHPNNMIVVRDDIENIITVPSIQAVTVAYDLNGGTSDYHIYDNNLYAPYSEVLINWNEPTKHGHDFIGWHANGLIWIRGDSIIISDDTVFVAQWQRKAYTINYDGFGIWFDALHGDLYGQLFEPELHNHIFHGWFSQPNGWGNEVTAYTIADDYSPKVLYPHWIATPSMLTVNYDLNAPYGRIPYPLSIDQIFLEENTTANLSLVGPTVTGYTFTSWNTQRDGNGWWFMPGDAIQVNDNLTLYAQWEYVTYRVSYEFYPGVYKTVYHGEPYGFLFQPTIDHLQFGGWWSQPWGEGFEITEYTIADEFSPKHIFPLWIVLLAEEPTDVNDILGDEPIGFEIHIEESLAYDIVIEWGNMQFAFIHEKRLWDPNTLSFTGSLINESEWLINNALMNNGIATEHYLENGNNMITITNTSNIDVTVTFTYVPNSTFNGGNNVVGGFYASQLDAITASRILYDPLSHPVYQAFQKNTILIPSANGGLNHTEHVFFAFSGTSDISKYIDGKISKTGIIIVSVVPAS
jgi:uncharacterized repeat protein (TIGR02543 family)